MQYLSGDIEIVDKTTISLDMNYLHDDKQIILNKLMGSNIFLIDRGNINFDNLSKKLKLNLNFSVNPKILQSKLFTIPEQMLSQLNNFIGWQNINLDTTLDNFDLFNLDKFVLAENSKLSMNGMYELNLNPVGDFLYEQSYLSNYKISLLKDKKINKLTIHDLENDIFTIEEIGRASCRERV